MTTERGVRLLAGSLVGISLTLGHFASPAWHLLAAFVSLNLIQSAFSGFCPAEKILRGLEPRDRLARKGRSGRAAHC